MLYIFGYFICQIYFMKKIVIHTNFKYYVKNNIKLSKKEPIKMTGSNIFFCINFIYLLEM